MRNKSEEITYVNNDHAVTSISQGEVSKKTGTGYIAMSSENIAMDKEKCAKVIRIFKSQGLIILSLLGVTLGFALGFGIRSLSPSQTALMWLGLPGELWMRLLKLMILPLVITSVLSGTASLDPKSNGKISIVAFIFVIVTNLFGCLIALVLVLIAKPGDDVYTPTDKKETTIVETIDIFTDLLRNILPNNIVEMTFSQTQTSNTAKYQTIEHNTTNGTVNETIRTLDKVVGRSSGPNLLGVITTCLLIGIAAGKHKEKTKIFTEFVQALEIVFLQVLRWLLWVTPIGVFSLILVSIAEIKDLATVFEEIGIFVGIVTAGIAFHQLVLMPIIFFTITRTNPYSFLIDIGRAWITAFATTSTAVAIPEMLAACEKDDRVEKRVSRFVIPFCVALNADGSALFITAAAVFVGNMAGFPFTAGDYTVICILTAMATLALPSVPSSSIVTLLMVLTSLNIPSEGISVLFAVEWFLDRIRTSSNALSHTHCAVITGHLCKGSIKDLGKIPLEEYELNPEIIVSEN